MKKFGDLVPGDIVFFLDIQAEHYNKLEVVEIKVFPSYIGYDTLEIKVKLEDDEFVYYFPPEKTVISNARGDVFYSDSSEFKDYLRETISLKITEKNYEGAWKCIQILDTL